ANQKEQKSSQRLVALDLPTVMAQAPPTNTTIYVGNLDREVTEAQLSQKFEPFGVMEEIRFQPERGFGFIKFSDHASAARAIVGNHGVMMLRQPMRCAWGRERHPTTPFHNPSIHHGALRGPGHHANH